MRSVVYLMQDIVAFNAANRFLICLYKSWSHVSGDMYCYSDPVFVKFVGRRKIIVTVRVISAASTIFSCYKSNISEQIKLLFDLDNVAIVVQHIDDVKKISATKSSTINFSNMCCTKPIDNNIKNLRLRSALDMLYSFVVCKSGKKDDFT